MDIFAKAPGGVISGFDRIIVGDDDSDLGTPAQARKHSFSILMSRMAAVARDLDPKTTNDLLNLIQVHVLEGGDPHDIDETLLATELVSALSKVYFPGGIPPVSPTQAILADLAEIDPDVWSVSRTGSIWVTNSLGVLTEVEANTLAVDYSATEQASIPIFPARTNTFIRSDAVTALAYVPDDNTSRIRTLGTSVVGQIGAGLLSPAGDDRAIVVEDIAGSGTFGVELESIGTSAAGDECDVVSIFAYPLENDYITLQLKDASESLDLSTHWATFNVRVGSLINAGSGIADSDTYIQISPSGWVRVGIKYTIAGSQDIGLTVKSHSHPTTLSYTGDGSEICALYGPCNMAGAGLAPYAETTGIAAGYGDTVLTFDWAGVVNGANGTFAAEWMSFNNGEETVGARRGTKLFSIDGVPIMTQEDGGYEVSVGLVSGSVLLEDNTIHRAAISYSADKVRFQVTGTRTQTAFEDLSNDPYGNDAELTIGPALGYLKSFSFYPVFSEDERLCEFLTGEGVAS